MNHKHLVIFGEKTNILTRQAKELAELIGYTDIKVTDQYPADLGDVFLTTEDKVQRKQHIDQIGRDRIVNLIHPTAYVSASAILGCNIFVGPQTVIGMNAIIGDGVVQNALSSIEHDNKIGEFSFFGTGSILCGRVETGPEVFIGGGATIKPGTTVGARTTIGTGAVLVKDADPDSVYVGNPARKLDR
jgi:sugar O-acyltransferase (sialic acid O-acetyltransferase NeuD family)